MDTLMNALPSIYQYGLGMIEGFYGSNTLDLLTDDDQKPTENHGDSVLEDHEDGDDDLLDVAGNSMVPPNPFVREFALRIIREEQERYFRDNHARY